MTGLTENIAILTRVAPATPPGSEDSDLREYQLQEQRQQEFTWRLKGPQTKSTHLVSSASSSGPTLPLILSILT